MQISIVGECDKRPFVYTLLDVCQYLGDVLFVTPDKSYEHFMEDKEEVGDIVLGNFQNITIAISDHTPDDFLRSSGYDNESFDYIIYDNQVDASGSAIIYICTGDMTARERELLMFFNEADYITINYGHGKNAIPVRDKTDAICGVIEDRKALTLVSDPITNRIFKIIGDLVAIPVKTLRKAVK